jgi:hypothetical protein
MRYQLSTGEPTRLGLRQIGIIGSMDLEAHNVKYN